MLGVLRRLFGGGPAPSVSATKTAGRSSPTEILVRRTHASTGSSTSRAAGEIDFDPYNTGVFDRSASWERIGKRNL